MNIKEASEQIKGAIRAYMSRDDRGLYRIPFRMQRPIIMLGPPGVGKTAVVEQIAAELDINFVSYSITHHTRQSALGLPYIAQEEFAGREYSVSEYTMSEIIAAVYRAQEESGVEQGILFLDEVNCVSETLSPAMLQFLQYKTFGMHKLPEGWAIVTAGNPPEYNRAAHDFDPAMLDRLMKIDVEPDLAVWQEYAASHGVHPAVTTYLEAKPGNFYKVRASARGSKIVTSRGWEDLSRMLQAYEAEGMVPPAGLPGRYLQDPEVAEDFSVYYELFRKYQDNYKVSEILEEGAAQELVERAQAAAFDERIALVGLLLDASLTRVHQALELEEALMLARGDMLALKPQLEAASADETGALVAAYAADVKQAGTVGKRLKGQVGDDIAVKAERLHVLDVVAHAAAGQTGFEPVKAAYNGECKRHRALVEACVAALDNCFAFLDSAFGEDAQESLIYVTKLSVDPVLVKFIANHRSEQYMKHNKNLLFSAREDALLRALEDLM